MINLASNPSNLTFLDCGSTNLTITNIPIDITNLTDVSYVLQKFEDDYQCGISYYQYMNKHKRQLGSELMSRDLQPNITSQEYDCGLSNLAISLENTNGTDFYDNVIYNCGLSYAVNKATKSDSQMIKIPKLLLMVSLLSVILSLI
ncbi:hypothetical protein DFJ63DRAFT_314214 [Scheffersomyces coipomensis]|uniref:uncharacterized protein n=1 Tax=Scheffersomyces coipomensis TaxID=1788519 RepID=UPI00315C6C35